MFKKTKDTKRKDTKINVMTITPRELKDKLRKLPVITATTEAKNNQIIEGDYGDAHFKVTKERLAKCPDYIFYVLRVSGPSESNRLTIISQVKTLLLDHPPIEFPAQALVDTDSLFWDAKSIKE